MINKLKKTNDLAGIVFHAVLSLILPVLLFILTNNFNLYLVAFALVVVSKWRVFMVSPRFWLDNIKANGVDFVFGFSVVSIAYLVGRGGIVTGAPTVDTIFFWRVAIMAAYAFWLIVVKHLSHKLGVLVQALCSLGLGLVASFWLLAIFSQPVVGIMVILVVSSCSYHIRLSYQDSPEGKNISLMWLIAISFFLPFMFAWVKSFTILNGLVLTTSGLIIGILFGNFELGYYLVKKSKGGALRIASLIFTITSVGAIITWLALN